MKIKLSHLLLVLTLLSTSALQATSQTGVHTHVSALPDAVSVITSASAPKVYNVLHQYDGATCTGDSRSGVTKGRVLWVANAKAPAGYADGDVDGFYMHTYDPSGVRKPKIGEVTQVSMSAGAVHCEFTKGHVRLVGRGSEDVYGVNNFNGSVTLEVTDKAGATDAFVVSFKPDTEKKKGSPVSGKIFDGSDDPSQGGADERILLGVKSW